MAVIDAWRNWVSDNPFLLRDLRRWERRGYAWKVPLICAGLPGAAVLALHSAARADLLPVGWARGPRFGLIAFSVATLLHLAATLGFGETTFSFLKEAISERLAFVRLLPTPAWALMLQVGMARSLPRLYPAAVALPVFVVLLAYGGVRPGDVAGYYFLLGLILFTLPAPFELFHALAGHYGVGAARVGDGGAGAASRRAIGMLTWLLALWVPAQFLMQPVLIPLTGGLVRRMETAFGPDMLALFPLSLLPALSRLAWEPAAFFDWTIPPLWPLIGCFALERAWRLAAAADFWAREPVVVSLPGGRSELALPESTARAELLRRRRWFAAAAAAAFTLACCGFAWRSEIASGALGALIRRPTRAGSAAALLILLALPCIMAVLERLRSSGASAAASRRLSAREAAIAMMGSLGGAVSLVLLSCAAGRVLPWPEPPAALGQLAQAASAGLVFGLGWQAKLARLPEESGATGRAWMAPALWLASYLLPLIALARRGSGIPWHAIAAWSPVYGLLSLLPGFWPSPSPLPGWLPPLAAASAGGLLLLAGRRRRLGAVKERSRRDPLEWGFRRLAARWDNPLFTLALRRLARRPVGLAARWALALAGGIGFPLATFGTVLFTVVQRRGLTLEQALSWKLGRSGVSFGGWLGLTVALLTFLFTLYFWELSANVAVSVEGLLARRQRRLPFLRLMPDAARQVVSGTLAAALLATGTPAAGALFSGLLWALLAVRYRVPSAWLLAWAWSAVVAGCVAAHAALAGFHLWRGRRDAWYGLRWLLNFVLTSVPPLIVIRISNRAWVPGYRAALAAHLPRILPLAAALLFLTLPLSYWLALRAFHACRDEDDQAVGG